MISSYTLLTESKPREQDDVEDVLPSREKDKFARKKKTQEVFKKDLIINGHKTRVTFLVDPATKLLIPAEMKRIQKKSEEKDK